MRQIHKTTTEETRPPRFDSDLMFWQKHFELPMPPLPPNFHGPALPPEEVDEADFK